MSTKTLIDIRGTTSKGKTVSVYRYTSQDLAIKAFMEKYPRFVGQAMIFATQYNEVSEGIYSASNVSQLLNWFESSKQLKGWI